MKHELWPLLPEPVAWFRAPYGTLEPNPLFRVSGPQSLEWSVACFTEYQLRASVAAAVAPLEAEIQALRKDAERYRSLVRWDGLPPAATDTVWIEPGRAAMGEKL